MASSSLFCAVLLIGFVAIGFACGPWHRPPPGKPIVYQDPIGYFQRCVLDVATGFLKSTKWKVNETALFVAQVYEQAGGSVPNTHWYCWCPIGVAEWGKSNSTYLTCNMCWVRTNSPREGDVAGNGKMVAIVAEKNTTIHPSTGGVVVKDKLAFQPGSSQGFIFWRYFC